MKRIINVINNNKYFIINSIIPFIVFLIIFLLYYPGIVSYDGANQWQQVQTGIISDSHPFFSTFFMYILSKIHNSIGIVLLFQMCVFSLFWGYFCSLIKTNTKMEIVKIVFTFLISLLPIISLYSITLWKDILYTYYLFMLGVMLFKGIKIDFNYKIYDYIIFGILLFLINSYRHNAIVVVALFSLLIFIMLIKSKRIKDIKYMKNVFLGVATFIILTIIISIPKSYYLSKSTKINNSKQTKEELESKVPLKTNYVLWMLAAHIKDGNITDKKDVKILRNVLDFKTWKEIYNPYLINTITASDKINGKYVNNNSDKIFNIFIKNTIRHPGTIIIHYLKSDALLINPVSQKYGYIYIYNFSEYDPYGFDAITSSKNRYLQKKYDVLINYSMRSPFKYLYQPAFMLYLSIILLIILSKKVYNKKIYLFAVPMIFNTASLLPINLAQDLRYVYINFITFFAILLLFVINYKKIFVKKKKK